MAAAILCTRVHSRRPISTGITDYRSVASAPAGAAPPALKADTKTIGLLRLLGQPLHVAAADSGWLHQLPSVETESLRRARIELLVPVSLSPMNREALLALGQKKSEEPYAGEDQELLLAIASSLAILLERPASTPSHSATEDFPPRLVMNRYRLEGRLGSGGMGTVYRAHDTVLDRLVAVKAIREDLVSSTDMAERFRREARAAAAVTHPNLVTLYDFAVDSDNRAFLIMELLTGRTLRRRLRDAGRLPPAAALDIIRALCSAIAIAHQRGLVHRDLKPENVFLADDASGREVPKILDFGVAKFLGSGEAATRATLETGEGVLLGTTAYISPEQLTGEPPSRKSDLWALAVVTYEALTGAHPFGSRVSVSALQNAILAGQTTPVVTHMPDAPPDWQPFFSASLNADASRRPRSAAEFLTQFERALGTAV